MNHLWRIEMFGGLRAVLNPVSAGPSAAPVIERFRTQKTAALLAYLAFYPKPQSREVLAEMLWPDHDPKTGSQSLRTALASLRRQLEPPGVAAGSVLIANRSSVRLHEHSVTTDVSEFENAIKEARKAPSTAVAAEAYERAVNLYDGRLLPGHYDEWVTGEADRLENSYFDALGRVVAFYEASRQTDRALHYAQLGARIDEERPEVLDALERLGVETHPGEAERKTGRPSKVKKKPRPAMEVDLPVRVAVAAPSRVTLPPQFTRFFGREQEIAQVRAELMESPARLLTLTGAGGSGKTRLAIEAARRLGEELGEDSNGESWPQAVCFVPLADIRDADFVAPAIVAALNLPRANESLLTGAPSPEHFPLERLVTALQARPSLLVLDNFEHVAEAAPLLEVLLARVPSLKLLVTSQHRLQVAGERELPVGALPTIAGDDFEDILAAASTQLFVERAQAARADFQITRQNAGDIARLCVALEGIPLAIELAAARAGVLTPSQIASQLEQARAQEGGRLDYLKRQKRPATQRHLSLRTAINWSYGLLPPELAQFWTRLAVFSGSFLPDAAQTVCAQEKTLFWLGQLRTCSLLAAEEQDGAMRFRWSELLREFAAEVLDADAEEATTVRRRHAEYFCDALADGVVRLRTPDEPGALRQAALEADNARSALAWAQEAGEHSLCAALSLSLGTTLQRRGLHSEALERLACGLEACAHLPGEYDIQRANLMREKAGVHLDLMQWEEARQQAQEFQVLCKQLDDVKGVAESTNLLGLAAKSLRQWKKARQHFAEALSSFDEMEDEFGVANARNNLGLVEYLDPSGDKEAASVHLRKTLEMRRALADVRGVAEAYINLGALAQDSGELDEANRYYSEALDTEAQLNHIFGVGRALCNLGEVAEARGEAVRAFRCYVAAQGLFEIAGIAYREYSSERAAHLEAKVSQAASLRDQARRYAEAGEIEKLTLWTSS